MTQLRDVFYTVLAGSPAICRFLATIHERLTDTNVKDLKDPCDMDACELTSRLYVADKEQHIWPVSSAGENLQHWLSC